MKPIPKTITIKCPKDIYDEIIKCGYFPSTELIQPEDEVEFVSKEILMDITCNVCRYKHKGIKLTTNFLSCCSYGKGNNQKYYHKETFGTHKATPIAVGVELVEDIRCQNKLCENIDYICHCENQNFKSVGWGFISQEKIESEELEERKNDICIFDEDYQTDLSEKLYNWIKENFKGNFIMNRLYEKDNDDK